MSSFQDASVQIHNYLSITLQTTCIAGDPLWKMVVNSRVLGVVQPAFITNQKV